MRMQDEVLRLWQARGTTMLLVTHDIDEAIYMSDRIVIMTPRPGRIERIIDVTLPRPRERNSPEFLRLRGEILELLHFAGHAPTQAGLALLPVQQLPNSQRFGHAPSLRLTTALDIAGIAIEHFGNVADAAFLQFYFHTAEVRWIGRRKNSGDESRQLLPNVGVITLE